MANRRQDRCPIHGLVTFVQSSPMCKAHCELCLADEIRKRQALMAKPTHEYAPMGIAEHLHVGVGAVCHYHGFHVEAYLETEDGLRVWLENNSAFRRLFETLTSGEHGYVAIDKFELQSDLVIVHHRSGGTAIYKLELIKEEDAEPEHEG